MQVTITDNTEPIEDLAKMLKILSNPTCLKLLFIIKNLKAIEEEEIKKLNRNFLETCIKDSNDEDLDFIKSNEEEILDYLLSLRDLLDSKKMPAKIHIKKYLNENFKITISDEKIKNYLKDLEEKREVLDVNRLGRELTKNYGDSFVSQTISDNLKKLEKHGFISQQDEHITRSTKGTRTVKGYHSLLNDLGSLFYDLSSLNAPPNKDSSEKKKGNGFELKITNEKGLEKYIHIENLKDGNVIKIGRKDKSYELEDNDNEINIVLSSSYTGASRICKPHAWITFEEDNFYFTDNKTGSSSYLGMKKLEPGKRTILKDIENIRLGNTKKVARMIFKRDE